MTVTMDSQFNCAANNNTSSTTNSNRNGNRRGYNPNRRTNNNRSKKKPSNTPTTKCKPTFVGLSADKIKAVVADEPGLGPLSVQLGRFEKEVLAYVKASLNANGAKAICKLILIDFTESQYLSKAIDSKKYTTVVVKKAKDGTADDKEAVPTLAIDEGQKDLLDSINNSVVQIYRPRCDQYRIYMENLFGIMEGNLDQNILALLEVDSSYGNIVDTQDPIALTKLLRQVCRKERGNCYGIDTFIVSMLDLLSCAQKADTANDFVALIKLNDDILETQFGMDWIPSALKTAVITMYPDTTWSGDTYDECSVEDQATINRHTKNRILAHIGARRTIAKSNDISLKDHLHKSATTTNNVATGYSSDLAALTD